MFFRRIFAIQYFLQLLYSLDGILYILVADKLRRALVNELASQFATAHRSEWSSIKNNIRTSLKNYLYNKTKRTPMIFPIIVEIEE